MLAATPEFSVVGVCVSVSALEQRGRQLTPDLVVLDWEAQANAAGLPAELGRVAANVNTVVLADDPGPGECAALLGLGVRAVIPRDSSFHELRSTLHAAAEGLTVLESDLARSLAERLPRSSGEELRPVEELTHRELEVLELLAEGMGNKEIAARLGISEHTVKFHISSVLGKFSASNRTEAVACGIRQGLIVV